MPSHYPSSLVAAVENNRKSRASKKIHNIRKRHIATTKRVRRRKFCLYKMLNFPLNWNAQYVSKYDMILNANGQIFLVHMELMLKASDYLRVMMRTPMIERGQKEVMLPALSFNGLRAMINFVYTDRMRLTMEMMDEVLVAATFLQILPAVEVCSKYMRRRIDINNCMYIQVLADTFVIESALATVHSFLLKNFESFGETEDFLNLSASQLLLLLPDNRLCVRKEYPLFQLLRRWIEADPARLESVETLVQHIRLPLMYAEQIDEVSQVTFMMENPHCRELLKEAKDYHTRVVEQPFLQSTRTQVRSDQVRICQIFNDQVDCYNLVIKQADSILHFNKEMGNNPLLDNFCVLDNYLYVCVKRKLFRFDPRLLVWFELSSMIEERDNFVLVGLGEELFAFGGQFNFTMISKAECFSLKENKWKYVARMPSAAMYHAGAACNGLVYISGGYRGVLSEVFNDLDIFDPKENRWDEGTPMLMSRRWHVMEEVKGKLYVLGGVDAFEERNFEMFDPLTNQWSALKTGMKFWSPASCVVDNEIFFQEGNSLHAYDTETDSRRGGYEGFDGSGDPFFGLLLPK